MAKCSSTGSTFRRVFDGSTSAALAAPQPRVNHTNVGCFVPFITTTTARMQSMMRMLEKLTDGRGSKMFLFKTFPTLTSFEKQAPSSGHMLTEPWQRVGHAPLDFTN